MEEHDTSVPSCPFCEFTDSDTYFLMQHVELCHPENGYSPFIAVEDGQMTGTEATYSTPLSDVTPSKSPANAELFGDIDSYVECPAGCGEAITVAELPSHLDLHSAETIALEEVTQYPSKTVGYSPDMDSDLDYVHDGVDDLIPAKFAKSLRDRDGPRKGAVRDTAVQPRSTSHKKRKKERSKGLGTPTGAGTQLGKAELGPHAHEKQMPAWLHRMLEEGAPVTYENKIRADGTLARVEVIENESRGLVPVLSQLCELDETVERAWFCNPNVRHVFKMPKEGGFCGYRNIQMLISYIQDAKAPGFEHFPGRIPSILRLQDMIEQAWDMGINGNGKFETGGIKGTRKYIGTSEAQALFSSLGIKCEPAAFSSTKELTADESLLNAVREYFLQAPPEYADKKVIQTHLPPIYFQHPGHSLTIVGFELRTNGSSNLLVFDPMFKTSPAVQRLVGTRVDCPNPERILKAHRRCIGYLRRYDEFEILKLLPPSHPAKIEAKG
ncbi:hypothetical protein CPC735_028710 [Coccidioides posadasii C735 delta SOWgp]|uniref:UFSP1/2/DUB catalytic domain-containing protein n=1 Tax=Coccidioides posadasii (strain C735) TaxID=222929 RepID=C5P7Y5_COCP7|nr:hypothetical protein CPC735_028710 [Coccidioides posadasii C735 delta SOWgp]EER27535.1 hypothetical protein CPC735_028710 [Coccidioides posadasii C735 delta SOWgp]|eukprot:XP_003069680.1 hypothetical protein CPC735_028710 [Coccidioides posadasii C735 delta SOWgp]